MMTENQLRAFREGAPFHELVNDGKGYELLRIVETKSEETMTDLMNLDKKDLAISGLRLLLKKEIGTECVYCHREATDVCKRTINPFLQHHSINAMMPFRSRRRIHGQGIPTTEEAPFSRFLA